MRTFPTLRERLEHYKDCVREARARRDERKQEWEKVQKAYESEQTTYYVGDSQINVNLVYAYVETMLPSLVFNEPKLVATPLSMEAESARSTVEAAVSKELRASHLKTCLQRATLDMILKGVGVLQLGYLGGGLVPQGGQEGSIVEPESSDSPYGYRANRVYLMDHRPSRFLVDPRCCNSDLSDALWCGVEYCRRLDVVKSDPQYKLTGKLQPDAFTKEDGANETLYLKKEDWDKKTYEYVELIQYWDIQDRKIYTFNMKHDTFLNISKWDLPVRRFPFYVLAGSVSNRQFWSQSPIIPWFNLHEELNLLLSARLDFTLRLVPKTLAKKGSIDEEAKTQLTTPDPCIVEVDSGADSVRNVIGRLEIPSVPAEYWAFTNEVMERWQMISGVSLMDLGGMRAGERSAEETRRISSGGNIRRKILAQRISDPLQSLAYDTVRLMRRYYSHDDIVQISGERGDAVWQPFTGSELQEEYQWVADFEEMIPSSYQERMQRALQKLQIFTPYGPPPLGSGLVDIVPILQEVAKSLGIRKLDLLPEMQLAPKDPAYEWYLMKERGRELQPSQMEDVEFHMFVHETQIREEMAKPEGQRRWDALQKLLNHTEATKSLYQQMVLAAQAQQQMQAQKAGATPPGGNQGPDPGTTNNLSGQGGLFAGGPPELQELAAQLQGGFQ